VTLTVTDDDGATGTATAQVTATEAPNVAPTASFTSTVDGFGVAFNATGSSDTDGSIVSYAWNFGDGTTGTGANATRTYAAAGTYTVTLTVTDDDGATGTATAQVTAVDPGGPQVLIADLFERSTTNGLGTADIGGNWALTGTASNFSVANGTGRITLPTAGAMRFATLTGTTARDTDTTVQLALDKAPTGGGTFVGISSRKVGTTEYILRVRVRPGLTNLEMVRIVNGTATTIAGTTLPGIDYTAGTTINLRFQVTGNGTTSTLAGKAWFANTPEPAAPQLQTTDTTAALQGPGSIGIYGYNSSTVTNAPTQITIDNLRTTAVG
jgi:PKD repeat protein